MTSRWLSQAEADVAMKAAGLSEIRLRNAFIWESCRGSVLRALQASRKTSLRGTEHMELAELCARLETHKPPYN